MFYRIGELARGLLQAHIFLRRNAVTRCQSVDEFRQTEKKMYPFKIIVEKHTDGYVAYPLGLKGVVIGHGDTYKESVEDVTSAIRFYIETFGKEELEIEEPAMDVFVTEVNI